MRLAMFQPDIPQNLGAAIRLCACMGVSLDIIRPAAFPLGAAELRRAAMDYGAIAKSALHDSWDAFCSEHGERRLVLLTTRATQSVYDFQYREDDILLLGRESAGVPETVHGSVDASIILPMQPEARSLNVVVAGAMVLGEALRQTRQLP